MNPDQGGIMNGQMKNPRVPEVEVDAMFLDRWSPRAFSPEPVGEQELAALFEAARWAPSCFNEQPWLFLFGRQKEDLERFRSLLVEGNRAWADSAPVLGVIFARRNFDRNGKPNRHYAFDTGAAWLSLALQARKLGLYTHAMGGFDENGSYELLGVPKGRFEAMAAIAIGRRGEAGRLPENLAQKEIPSERKPLIEVAIEGRFTEDAE
jgi:nitroreductase